MEVNQDEFAKTEENRNSVSIEISNESFKEKNNIQQQNNISSLTAYEYIIIIKKLPLLNIKYFKFGKTIHFYLCCCLKEKEYKLAEIPTPPFSIGPECKLE